MAYLLNLLYLTAVVVLSPWLLFKMLTTGKYRRGLREKVLGLRSLPGLVPDKPTVWFHGVSVGEIHLLRQVLARFRQVYPECQCVVSTTTETGYDEACKRFADLPVFYWPLDFSWSVARSLAVVQPSLIVLAEGEWWPNFLGEAKRRHIPVAVINGRLSPKSYRRYRLLGPLTRRLLNRADLLLMQNEEYAQHCLALGVAPSRVRVTGNVKYDGVETDRTNARTVQLRQLFGLADDALVWVVGSTQRPEETIALELFTKLKAKYPELRLILVPRQKERFDEVAQLLAGSGKAFVRRSELPENRAPQHDPIVLVDTIGELGAVWGLADIAFVGGSLDGKRGGQNMIEPAAYGSAVVFGPHVWNFRADVERLLSAQAALQVQDVPGLHDAVIELCDNPLTRKRLGDAAKQLVAQQRGATMRTVEMLGELLPGQAQAKAA